MTPTPEQNAKRETLKPCPFCGHQQTDSDKHDHIVNHHDEGYAIHALACSKCGAVGPFGPEDDIEDAWNKRTPELAELRQAADGVAQAWEQSQCAHCDGSGVTDVDGEPLACDACFNRNNLIARYRALAGEGKEKDL